MNYKKEGENVEKLDDVTLINDCRKWAFFGCTIGRGKKNDHVFHEACITYINSYYDKLRDEAGKIPIEIVTVWTDQCPTQYRYGQNFRKIAESSKRRENVEKSVRIHKFGTKYRFKGP